MGVAYGRRLACEMVASELYAGILNGEYEVGRPLPAERVLARRFGVDRGTLREGLARLTARGVVYPRPGAGNWVTWAEDVMGGEQLVDWFELSDHLVVCEAAAFALLELRTTFLVRGAGRLARLDVSASELETLEHYVKVMEFHLGRGSLRMTILEAELSFQQGLVELAGMAFSVGFGPYAKLMRKYLYCFHQPETCPSIPVATYRTVLDLIQKKDRAGVMATLDGAFAEYDLKVVEVLVEESRNRIAYRRGAGPKATDWELELDQREQRRQYSLVGPSNQSPPPWRTPTRDAVHTDSPHVLPAPMAPHGPLHSTSPERKREMEELFQEYALPEESSASAPAPETPPPSSPSDDTPLGSDPPPAAPAEDTPPKPTSTDEREPDG